MCVLLGLGCVELTRAGGGKDLGERVRHPLLLEDDRALEVVAVARHRDDVDACLEQTLRQLADTVRPEVEDDRGVSGRVEPRAAREHDGLDELVGDAPRVARSQPPRRRRQPPRHAVEDRGQRRVGSFPAVVAVHRVVPADDRRDPRGRQGREVGHRRVGRHVAAVGERVNPCLLDHRLASGELEQRAQVIDVRVDAALRDEAEEVHRAAALAGAREGADGAHRWRTTSRPRQHASPVRGPGTRIRPEPIVRWPTSELPICPSGRPTAAPEATSCVLGYRATSSSKTGVRASSTALPGPGGAIPQPSRMTSVTSGSPFGVMRQRRGRSRRTSPGRATPRRRAHRPRRAAPSARRRSPA